MKLLYTGTPYRIEANDCCMEVTACGTVTFFDYNENDFPCYTIELDGGKTRLQVKEFQAVQLDA